MLSHNQFLKKQFVSGFLHPKRSSNQEKLASCCWHHTFDIQALKMRSRLTKGLQLSVPAPLFTMDCKEEARRSCADMLLEPLQWLTCDNAGNSLCWAGVGHCSATQKSWLSDHAFLLTPVLLLLILALPLSCQSFYSAAQTLCCAAPSVSRSGKLTASTKSLDNLPSINQLKTCLL